MQVNRQLIVILILASLLLSALGAAFYFYKKSVEEKKSVNELVTVYIAKNDIEKGTLLQVKHLAQTQIARQFILNEPLLKKELLGKYTKENIYKHEIFLKQKLTTKVEKEKAKIIPFENSSYNMKFDFFENPNYSLNQGDYINIMSVIPKGKIDKKGKYSDYSVQYVAKGIKILGFLRNGFRESETITKQKIKKIVKKKEIEEIIDVKSDEMILDVDLNVLLKLIKDYNKGNQLWMVKTKFAPEVKAFPTKAKANKVTAKQTVQRTYPYKLFTPVNKAIKRSAVIQYANDKEGDKSKSKSVNIAIDYSKQCSSIKETFVMGKSKRFNVREKPTTKSTIKRVLDRNTIIPYKSLEGDWYLICDNNYVHKNVVKKVNAKFVKEKVGLK
ncbi:SAF domain-containing protein [Halarcobacter ebronensis]|uniref:SH3 domain-containing protein n=1 Tax=Halarcobacter ebronensis TaxID=1462615 RepID=UPI003C70C6D0